MAKTYGGILEELAGFDSLLDAFFRARKGKRHRPASLLFERDLEGNLIQLQNELIWGQYTTSGYRSFYVNEPKRRKITALKSFRDRVVQQAVVAHIEPIWEARFISDSYGCRVGKGTHAGASRAQEMMRHCLRRHGQVFALKADIRRFFASIDHGVLKLQLRRRIRCPGTLRLLDDIIDSYREGRAAVGLPIGNLTSQLFANVYLDDLDQWIKCRRREQWYARYMDDFIVIHHDKRHLSALRIDAERFLADQLALETNHKTGVFPVAHRCGRGLDFLGFHLWPDRRRLRKASLKRFKRRVRRLQGLHAQGLVELSEVWPQIQSWVAHAKHGDALPAISKTLNNTPFRRSQ